MPDGFPVRSRFSEKRAKFIFQRPEAFRGRATLKSTSVTRQGQGRGSPPLWDNQFGKTFFQTKGFASISENLRRYCSLNPHVQGIFL